MIPEDSQNLESYVPVYDVVPAKWEEARPFLVEQLKKITNAVNVREIGWFLDQELLSGKAWIPGINNSTATAGTSQSFRTVLRKVVDFGPLPNAGTKTVPHGILFDENFTLVDLWASATDPIGFVALNIPHASPASLANNISIFLNATDIVIITGANRSNFTRCFVVIEYLQEL